jgi:hypothetical protein
VARRRSVAHDRTIARQPSHCSAYSCASVAQIDTAYFIRYKNLAPAYLLQSAHDLRSLRREFHRAS